jgi:hypothetical protein
MSNRESSAKTLRDRGQYPRRKTSIAPFRKPQNSISYPHPSTVPLLKTQKELEIKKEGRKKEEKEAN